MIEKPNVRIPLAASYNERGNDGFDSVFTSANDQRKINSIYEPVRNAITQRTTLYLSKRPGVRVSSNSFGSSSQTAYKIINGAGLFTGGESGYWVFSVLTNDIRASNSGGTTTTIATAAGYYPRYVDKVSISDVDTVVLQLSNGGTGFQVWYSSAIATWAQITDGDFTGISLVGKMEHMNGVTFAANSANNSVHNSDPNSVANWTAGNRIKKSIQQDGLNGLAKFNQTILAFGNESVEIFRYAGNDFGSPLVRGGAAKVGIANTDGGAVGLTNYYTIVGDKLYLVGRESKNQISIYAYAGGEQFQRVSNDHIDQILVSGVVYSINSMMFGGRRAFSLQLDAPTSSTQRWLMCFPDLNYEWFEWNSTKFSPVSAEGHWFVGVGSNANKIYLMDTINDNWQDDGVNYDMVHQFAMPVDGNERKFMHMCGLVGDTARSAMTYSVQFSDDDGQNYSTARTIDMTSTQKMLTRCGSYRNRFVRLTNSGNHEGRISQFVARVG